MKQPRASLDHRYWARELARRRGATSTGRSSAARCAPGPSSIRSALRHIPCIRWLALDFAKQIPRTTDQRQMERWQRIGVYAAGLALADAGAFSEIRSCSIGPICASLPATASAILRSMPRSLPPSAPAAAARGRSQPRADDRTEAHALPRPAFQPARRPTSRSFTRRPAPRAPSRVRRWRACRRLRMPSSGLRRAKASSFLVGGALNAERDDLLLGCELADGLYGGPIPIRMGAARSRRRLRARQRWGISGASRQRAMPEHRGASRMRASPRILSDRSRRGQGHAAASDGPTLREPRARRAGDGKTRAF